MYNGSKCRLFAEVPAKISRRIAAIAAREARRFVAMASERAALSERIRKQRPSFRPLSPHGRLMLTVLGGLAECSSAT